MVEMVGHREARRRGAMNILNSGMPSSAQLQRALCLRALLVCMAAMALLPPAAQTQTVETTVTVPFPAALAVNPVTNKIYVASSPITVIDGATNAVTSIVAGGFPVAVAANPVTNKIYFADKASNPGSVIVIDGATNAITTVTDPNANEPVALALNPLTNKIYVANGASNNVTVIDGTTNTTTTIAAGYIPFAVAVNPVTNKIYVVSQGGPVTVIDGATNATTSVATGGTDVAVNPVTNKIYVANYSDPGTVTVIDGATNATTTVATGSLARFVAVNPVTNKIYVANQGGNNNGNTVTVIDGSTNATATVNTGTGPSAIAVNAATNTIYVGNVNSNNVTVIDGTTNTTTTVTDASASSPYGAAVNPLTNKIYVANLNGKVTVIDGATNTAATVTVGVGPGTPAVNPATDKIYVANRGDGVNPSTLTVIDGAMNTTTTINVGVAPFLVVNPLTNKIYVAESSGALSPSTITVIDGITDGTTTITDANAHVPSAMAVNPLTNKIYVANVGGSGSQSTVTVIDGATNELTDIINPSSNGARAIDVNPVTNKIYVANGDNPGTVKVIDGVTNLTTTVAVGTDPIAVAVNPLTNKIYVANHGSNTVTVIDGATNATSTVHVGVNPLGVVVNPLSNKIYVLNTSNVLTVIDGAVANTTSTITGSTSFNGLAVNLASNKVYATNFNTNVVTVIDGVTNNIAATLATGTGPTGLAVNPITGKIYVANFNTTTAPGTTVTVISEARVQPSPLTTAIAPLTGNATSNAAEVFQFAVTDAAPPLATNVIFQLDTLEGPWTQGTSSGSSGNFTGAVSELSLGTHILYAAGTDGEEATSVMRASSPVLGGVAAYFFGEQGVSTNTTLIADVNPAAVGQQVTLTAAIFSSASGLPAGSVSFFDGSTFLENVPLDSTGHAMLQTNLLTLGAHFIRAFYLPSPSAGFAASTSAPLNESVLRATSTALTSSVPGISTKQQVVFTAAVSSATSGTPTGNVTFLDGTAQIGTAALNANAQATLSTSSLAAGSHSIRAAYSGDASFAPSTSAVLIESVTAPLDFAVTAAPGGFTSATIKAGQTAMYSLELSLTGGVPTDQLTVTATCAGVPPKATCSGPTAPVTVTQGAPATVAISISTTANSSLIPWGPFSLRQPMNRWRVLGLFVLLVFLSMLVRNNAGTRRFHRRPASPAFVAAALACALAAVTITGCNGGSMSSTPPPVANGTPAGTYTLVLTFTATQPSGGAHLSHTQQLTLTVQ